MFSRDCKFVLSDEEYEQIKIWHDTHECTLKERHGVPKYSGAIGGGESVEFTPTSLGIIKTVKCACGSEFKLSQL